LPGIPARRCTQIVHQLPTVRQSGLVDSTALWRRRLDGTRTTVEVSDGSRAKAWQSKHQWKHVAFEKMHLAGEFWAPTTRAGEHAPQNTRTFWTFGVPYVAYHAGAVSVTFMPRLLAS